MSGDGDKSTHLHDKKKDEREGTTPVKAGPAGSTVGSIAPSAFIVAMSDTGSHEDVQLKDADGDNIPSDKDGNKADGNIPACPTHFALDCCRHP